jgi:pyruvate dehydrogenase E1 component beta subunit
MLTYAEAIGAATVQAMEADPSIVLLGSGVTYQSGVFGTTTAAYQQFPDRVFEPPNSEAALGGICCGLAAMGKRPLWVHQRDDFLTYAMDPIVNLLAKWSAMYSCPPLPIVIRAIVGRGWGQGCTHSQFLASTFAHFPGLTVVAPYDVATAAEFLHDALTGQEPTLLIEHRVLYDTRFLEPSTAGTVLLVATSNGVQDACAAAKRLRDDADVGCEVMALGSLRPFPRRALERALERTHWCVIVDSGWTTYGFSAEVAAVAAESGFLKAPVVRIGPPDVPAPVAAPLEAAYWPGPQAIVRAVLRLLGRAGAPAADPPSTFQGPY